jgi:predicted XRE-type DNA-binding protein
MPKRKALPSYAQQHAEQILRFSQMPMEDQEYFLERAKQKLRDVERGEPIRQPSKFAKMQIRGLRIRIVQITKAIEIKQAEKGGAEVAARTAPIRFERGFRDEIKTWIKTAGFGSQADAARHLGISLSTLTAIMRRDSKRYGKETLKRVLKKIGFIDQDR